MVFFMENTINEFIKYFKLYEDEYGNRTDKYIYFLLNELLPTINNGHDMSKFYKKFNISKKSGGNRIIYEPEYLLKDLQKKNCT